MTSLSMEDEPLLLGPLPEPNIIVPAQINKHLKLCQRDVVRFLYAHYFHNEGAILSDKSDLHNVLPLAVFFSSLVNRGIKEKILLVINEDEKICLNMWLNYFKHVGIDANQIKYCGKNTTNYQSGNNEADPCIYVINTKRLEDHSSFLKQARWTCIVYDNFGEKSSLTSILNYAKDWKTDLRFIISRQTIFHSKKYFWSLFKFINKAELLAKTWKEFEECQYEYYFNKVDRTSEGKMSKMDIYKSLEATRIRFKYVSRNIPCSDGDIHDKEPWSDNHTASDTN